MLEKEIAKDIRSQLTLFSYKEEENAKSNTSGFKRGNEGTR